MFANLKTSFVLLVAPICVLLLKTSLCNAAAAAGNDTKKITATFFANITKLENGVPFLGSCKIENFIGHPERNYTVSYYRTSVGFAKNLIGWHELSGNNNDN